MPSKKGKGRTTRANAQAAGARVAAHEPKDPVPQAPRRWELAPRQDVLASALLRNENDLIGQFFLGLAVGFNDLKGLVLFEQYLLAMGRPKQPALTPYFGQWHGTNAQVQRWIVGVLHEILNVIGARRFRGVREGAELTQLVAKLAPENQALWKELVETAAGAGGTQTLLAKIRNNAAFHYGNKGSSLADAYLEFFAATTTPATAGTNTHAMFSSGIDMDGTRFYYADAAAQHELRRQLEQKSLSMDDVFHLANKINVALASLLGKFIGSRASAE